jgi:hypothetical protein
MNDCAIPAGNMQRMQNAESCAVLSEVVFNITMDFKYNGPVRTSLNPGLPSDNLNTIVHVSAIVGDLKRRGIMPDLLIQDCTADGIPVLIAERKVDHA